jgi:parallel beta-helix repeat protein
LFSVSFFLLLFFIPSYATVTINPEGEKFVGINPSQAIYVKKSYFGEYIDFEIEQVNTTHWNVSYEINESLINSSKECWNLCQDEGWLSLNCYNCWKGVKNTYFPDADLTRLLGHVKNIKKYPIRALTKNIIANKVSVDYLEKKDYFYLIFPKGFKNWEKVEMGFGTVTFVAGSQSPGNRDAFTNLYFNASIQPYSDTSTVINCTLYVDGIANDTIINGANNSVFYLNSSILSEGSHSWYINCSDDNYATETQSSIYTVYVGGKIDNCANLVVDYGVYDLTGDILNSGTSNCINIPNNHIVLNGQYHTVDGNDVADYGIYVYRSSATTTNITIANITLTDWDSANIYMKYANLNTIKNMIANSSPDYGLYLYYFDTNTLSNVTANNNNNYGLYLYYSDGNTLSNVTANSNSYGLRLYYSDGNTVSNSNFKDNTYWDIFVLTTVDFNLELTNVNGTDDKPIVCYNTTVTLTNWNNNASEIILLNADYSVLDNIFLNRTGTTKNNGILAASVDYANFTNIQVHNMYQGFHLRYVLNSRSENVTSNSNTYGLYFYSFDDNTLSNITANNNNYGLYLYYSDSNTLSNITFNSNSYGLWLYYSDGNTLSNVTANSNSYGLYFYSSDSNTIHDSWFQDNTYAGVYLYSAGGGGANTFYNNLFNNTGTYGNIRFGGTIYANYWNTTRQSGTRIYSAGTEIGGNYWTNSSGNGYSDTCTDADADGFCDSSYTLDTDNIDYLPLSDEYSVAIQNYYRTSSDSLSLSEFKEERYSGSRTPSEPLVIFEQKVEQKNILRFPSDLLTSLDVSSKIKGIWKTTLDFMTSSESTTELKKAYRTLLDSLGFSDLASKLRGISRSTSDYITLNRVTSHYLEFYRSLIDSLTFFFSTSTNTTGIITTTTTTTTVPVEGPGTQPGTPGMLPPTLERIKTVILCPMNTTWNETLQMCVPIPPPRHIIVLQFLKTPLGILSAGITSLILITKTKKSLTKEIGKEITLRIRTLKSLIKKPKP